MLRISQSCSSPTFLVAGGPEWGEGGGKEVMILWEGQAHVQVRAHTRAPATFAATLVQVGPQAPTRLMRGHERLQQGSREWGRVRAPASHSCGPVAIRPRPSWGPLF